MLFSQIQRLIISKLKHEKVRLMFVSESKAAASRILRSLRFGLFPLQWLRLALTSLSKSMSQFVYEHFMMGLQCKEIFVKHRA